MKEAYYFSHDSNARNDLKMVKLRRLCGLEGIGLFWCVVEMLREADRYKLSIDVISSICFELRVDEKIFENLFECELLKKNGSYFYTESLLKRMKKREKISKIRAKVGKIGGGMSNKKTTSKSQAIAEQSLAKIKQLPSIKGKERKGKEIKGNEIKIKEIKGNEMKEKEIKEKEKKIKKERKDVVELSDMSDEEKLIKQINDDVRFWTNRPTELAFGEIDKYKELYNEFGRDKVHDAMGKAREQNKFSIAYIRGILTNKKPKRDSKGFEW